MSTERERHGFCPECGNVLAIVPERTARYPSCSECNYVRYRNPTAGVAIVLRDSAGRVLMGRRASGSYAGLWCIPCGHVEWHEDIREAAVREFLEETGLVVETREVLAVHSNFHNPRQHTVGTWFAGIAVGGMLHPSDGEFTELAYLDPAAPPPLAFPTDALVLAELVRRAEAGLR